MPKRASKKKQDTGANLGFEAKLWAAADALLNNMDAAEYKHVVLASQSAVAEPLEALLTRKAVAVEEARTLAALRDALLPRLICAEIRTRVPDDAAKV